MPTSSVPTRPSTPSASCGPSKTRASELERRLEQHQVAFEQELRAALTQAPDLRDAHEMLADYYQARLAAAEQRRDQVAAIRYEALVRTHGSSQHRAYLRGTGALTLYTDPPGAEVELLAWEEKDRRLRAQHRMSLGRTPLLGVPLPMGSYLLILRAPGREEVHYPVHIDRLEHWHATPPGASASEPVHLPEKGTLAAGEVYVPAGWFWSGGDDGALDSLPRRRVWCPGFICGRTPVTNAQYLDFLNDLVASGRAKQAFMLAPTSRVSDRRDERDLLFRRDPKGYYQLHSDEEGVQWQPDWPVMFVDWYGAESFCRWLERKTAKPWRLPFELEWEKAARGVDARLFPWGNYLDPTWCAVRESRIDRPLPASVDDFPIDTSPYGVRHLAGNVREWCSDAATHEGPVVDGERVITQDEDLTFNDHVLRVARGGSWNEPSRGARAANRAGIDPQHRLYGVGVPAVPAVAGRGFLGSFQRSAFSVQRSAGDGDAFGVVRQWSAQRRCQSRARRLAPPTSVRLADRGQGATARTPHFRPPGGPRSARDGSHPPLPSAERTDVSARRLAPPLPSAWRTTLSARRLAPPHFRPQSGPRSGRDGSHPPLPSAWRTDVSAQRLAPPTSVRRADRGQGATARTPHFRPQSGPRSAPDGSHPPLPSAERTEVRARRLAPPTSVPQSGPRSAPDGSHPPLPSAERTDVRTRRLAPPTSVRRADRRQRPTARTPHFRPQSGPTSAPDGSHPPLPSA